MPATFHVVAKGLPREVARPMIREAAGELRNQTERNTPRRTGTLAAGWTVVPSGKSSWRVANDVPYARFVEYGTKHMRPAAMLGRALAQLQAQYGQRR
jgi:HK97 gp10 family phage protein